MEKSKLVLVTVTALEGPKGEAVQSRVFGVVADYEDVVANVVGAMDTALLADQPEEPELFALEVLADLLAAALGLTRDSKRTGPGAPGGAAPTQKSPALDQPSTQDAAAELERAGQQRMVV